MDKIYSNVQDIQSSTLKKMYILTLISLFFFSVGIHTSVSIPAGMHIFGFIPAIYFLLKDKHLLKELPISSWFLVFFIVTFMISAVFNFSTLMESLKSIGSIKYWIFGLLFVFPLYRYSLNLNIKYSRFFINLLLISVIVAAFIGIVRSKFQFDILTLKTNIFHERNGGFYAFMRYAYNLQFLLIIMTALIIFHQKLKEFYNFKILIFAYIMGWIGMIASETRGALLGSLLGISTLFILINKRKGLLFTGILFIFLFVSLVVVFNGGSNKIRILEKFNSSSNTIRLSQFEGALYALKEKPLFGHGPLQLRHQIQRIKIKYDLEHKEYYGQHAHNIFLEHLADYGIIGSLIFILWLLIWGNELLNSTWFNKFLIFPSFVTILVSGQFEYLFNSTGSFTIMLLYSLSITSYLKARKTHEIF